MDSNENPNFADAAQLYRHKINYLCDHVSSLTSSLERSTSEVTEVKQKIAMFRKTAEKQEFTNWCLHLDNERTIAEATSLTNSNRNLQDSISKFTTKLDKFESAQLKTELILKNKEKEISRKFKLRQLLDPIDIVVNIFRAHHVEDSNGAKAAGSQGEIESCPTRECKFVHAQNP